MAFALTFSPLFPSSSFPFNLSISPSIKFKPHLNPPKIPRFLAISSSNNNHHQSSSSSEQAILDAVSAFDAAQKSLPAVRTFENDLARLTLVGGVDFKQALTAAAADGGEAADEHLAEGVAAMVVETVFPVEDRSTVSTRLFLPARKVKERALKLRGSLTKDILNSTTSKNILAMTFRQVVLQQLWNLELALFRPGTKRNMDDLENPREVPVLLTLSSSDERIISEIGEVVCCAILRSTERHFLDSSVNKASNKFFSWFKKRELISSRDSSVTLYNFLEHEILANAKMLLEKFNLEGGNYKLDKVQNSKGSWWTSPAFTELKKIGGPEFCAWINECVPSYQLVIDGSKHSSVKFEGWLESKANSWEVVLTHSQMVSLADILDMYYEDVFTLPDKRLPCFAAAKSSSVALNKGNPLLKILSVVVASGIFLVTISVLRKLYMPHLPSRKNYVQEGSQTRLSDIDSAPNHPVELSEVNSYCVSMIRRIKDSFGWPGEISNQSGDGVWIGELPTYLRAVDDVESNTPGISSTSAKPTSDEEMNALKDIASYQVVLSSNGSIIGLQPTNRVAVNNWAANPLTKELYGGKSLSPGLVEPGLKMRNSSGMVVLELLMSVNPDSHFALVRSVDGW